MWMKIHICRNKNLRIDEPRFRQSRIAETLIASNCAYRQLITNDQDKALVNNTLFWNLMYSLLYNKRKIVKP